MQHLRPPHLLPPLPLPSAAIAPASNSATGATLLRHSQNVGNGTRGVPDDRHKKLHSGAERRLGELNNLRQKCGRNEDLALQRRQLVHAQR